VINKVFYLHWQHELKEGRHALTPTEIFTISASRDNAFPVAYSVYL